MPLRAKYFALMLMLEGICKREVSSSLPRDLGSSGEEAENALSFSSASCTEALSSSSTESSEGERDRRLFGILPRTGEFSGSEGLLSSEISELGESLDADNAVSSELTCGSRDLTGFLPMSELRLGVVC